MADGPNPVNTGAWEQVRMNTAPRQDGSFVAGQTVGVNISGWNTNDDVFIEPNSEFRNWVVERDDVVEDMAAAGRDRSEWTVLETHDDRTATIVSTDGETDVVATR